MVTAREFGCSNGEGDADLRLRRLAQRKLRQVIELLEADGSAELGGAFALVKDAELAIDRPGRAANADSA